LNHDLTIIAGGESSSKIDWAEWGWLIPGSVTVLLNGTAVNVQSETRRCQVWVAADSKLIDNELGITDVAVVNEHLIAAMAIGSRDD